jgi:hypothetical protein
MRWRSRRDFDRDRGTSSKCNSLFQYRFYTIERARFLVAGAGLMWTMRNAEVCQSNWVQPCVSA